MRDKLMELLSQYFDIGDSYVYNLTRAKSAFTVGTMSLDDFEEFDADTMADIADYLIANGVIVPPCKVGDLLYYPWCYDDISGVAILEVVKIVIKEETLVFIHDPESDMPMPCCFNIADFGKTVFTTREEAETVSREVQG